MSINYFYNLYIYAMRLKNSTGAIAQSKPLQASMKPNNNNDLANELYNGEETVASITT